MGRPKNKPNFDTDKLLDEMLKNVIEAYDHLDKSQIIGGQLAYGALKEISDELSFKPAKVKKLLITAGVRYDRDIVCNDTGRYVLFLHKRGKTIAEIMKETGLKRSAVFGYLPYTKTIYKADELSTDAERIRLFRLRQKRCQGFNAEINNMSNEEVESYLWDTLEFLQGCIFNTNGEGSRKGTRFRYVIRGGELVVDREEKPIAKATVMQAFDNTRMIQAEAGCVSDPKKIGTFGASYLYPIFIRLGVCTATAEGSIMDMK